MPKYNSWENYDDVKALYSKELLKGITDKIGITKEEEVDDFHELLIDLGANYIRLNKINSKEKRLSKGVQDEKINKHKKALSNLLSTYNDMREYDSPLARYHKALRNSLEANKHDDTNNEIRLMLSPYITLTEGNNLGGVGLDSFPRMIEYLMQACDDSLEVSLGSFKTDIRKDVLAYWVAYIKIYWPKESEVTFTLGDYLKGQDGGYKSECLNILYSLISIIDEKITERSLATAIEKVNKHGAGQQPTFFLLGNPK